MPILIGLILTRVMFTVALPLEKESDHQGGTGLLDYSFQNFTVEMQSQPFPEWLNRFTGLTEWPGLDPPYIPLDFIDLSKVSGVPLRKPGECTDRTICSFDCHKCISFDEVYTCPRLSQTFDDGPSPSTPKLLSQLRQKTTFFTLGVNVVKYPEIYRQMKAAGHLLASHTWSHKFLPSMTNEQIIAQFEWSIWAMNATGNHLPKWYRPPYGGIDNRVRDIARQFGMQAVLWDHDTFDWQLETTPPGRTKSVVYNDVKKWKAANAGGIILEHDAYASTVDAGIEIGKIIGPNQMTVAECVGGNNYIKVFG
ncbi:unnamed protein product [Kuraishia capsulata CBS 1993]|uniref:chitin deacetylase n=1 Tax=Kuraishia capsulata CBS 1993 TaxID=1382522 RepID=W6MRR3_9ASCO|nr:uncharacterized protein KUCA_T00003917001 [Kuraishia capsulata CBS 1993]CDK27937.1 unnamed protein product [Kuraishia capsulata CBS 1993]